MVEYPVSIVSKQPNNVVEIRWSANNVCNFNCHYCFPEAHARTHATTENLNLIIKNFNHLFAEYRKIGRNKIKFVITGGEPTLWTNFGKFLKGIDNVHVSVVSNGSRTLRWWKTYAQYIDNAILSFHINQANIDHHIAVADELFSQGKKVTVLVLMDTTKWNECVDSINYMKTHSKYDWFIETKPIIGVTYSGKQKEYLKKELKRHPGIIWFLKNLDLQVTKSVAILNTGKKINARSSTYINLGYDNFKGWNCNIGIESIYIHWDGELKGTCGQHPFGSVNILDEKFTESFSPTFKPSTCQISKCSCLPETHITKSLPLS